MPIYPRKCLTDSCDHWFEVVLPMRAYDPDGSHPCPKCEGASVKTYVPSGTPSMADPVIVYRAPDGTPRFPGDGNGISVAQYERLGYTRLELRGWADVRRFEKQENSRQGSDIARRVERHLEVREAANKARRSEVFAGLANGFSIPELDDKGNRTGRMKTVRMSAYGRDLMRQVIARTDGKPLERAYDPGFHSSAYNDDRSNREDSRRSDGTRNRD